MFENLEFFRCLTSPKPELFGKCSPVFSEMKSHLSEWALTPFEELQNKSSITCGTWTGTAWPSKELHKVKGWEQKHQTVADRIQKPMTWLNTEIHPGWEPQGSKHEATIGRVWGGGKEGDFSLCLGRWRIFRWDPSSQITWGREKWRMLPRRAQWFLHESPVPYWISLLLPT